MYVCECACVGCSFANKNGDSDLNDQVWCDREDPTAGNSDTQSLLSLPGLSSLMPTHIVTTCLCLDEIRSGMQRCLCAFTCTVGGGCVALGSQDVSIPRDLNPFINLPIAEIARLLHRSATVSSVRWCPSSCLQCFEGLLPAPSFHRSVLLHFGARALVPLHVLHGFVPM